MTDTVRISIEVKRELLKDLLTTAVEGGSNYWADFGKVKRDSDHCVESVRLSINDGSAARRDVSLQTMSTGLERLAKCATTARYANGNAFPAAAKHLADALSEDGDATTADVVLQMGLFNEVQFG